MKEYIASFIKEKDLSENSQAAYSYDLDQFVDTIHNHVSDTNLRIYQASIKDFKPACSKTEAFCRQSISILSLSTSGY